MKIIQPSSRYKAKTRSKPDNNSQSDSARQASNKIDPIVKSKQRDYPSQGRKWTKAKPNSIVKRQGADLLSPDLDSNNDELDFDTSKLEAMPKEELSTDIRRGKRRRSELLSDNPGDYSGLVIDPEKKVFNDLFARGVRLLAMREHSVKELTDKLLGKSDDTNTIFAVIDELMEKKYLSDERFTESYIRARGNRGFGPIKIKAELKSKGVSSTLIQDYLDESAAQWFDNAQSQYQKKYGDAPISDYNAWTKRARFMQSRGFTMEHIHVTVPRVEFD